MELSEHHVGARNTLVIAVIGDLDMSSVSVLTSRLQAVFNEPLYEIVIDLLGVTFFDSSGLSAIEAARVLATDHDCRLALVCTDPRVLRLFEITALLDLYVFHPSVEAALG